MLTAFLFTLLGISLIALVFALNTLIALFRDRVPYVSTPDWAIEWLCDNIVQYSPLLAKERGRGEVVDLGCGDARVLVAIKKQHLAITAIGIERNWWPFILARIKTRGTGVIVRRADFYKADLSDAAVVFCFLIHSVMPKVEATIRRQLRPGATVYSYGFSFPNWQPAERIANPKRPRGSKLNVYVA